MQTENGNEEILAAAKALVKMKSGGSFAFRRMKRAEIVANKAIMDMKYLGRLTRRKSFLFNSTVKITLEYTFFEEVHNSSDSRRYKIWINKTLVEDDMRAKLASMNIPEEEIKAKVDKWIEGQALNPRPS